MEEFNVESFWKKIKKYALMAGREVIELALKLYYATMDSDTPAWAKTVITGSLVYFILPVDAVPDLLPGGYVDDFGALAAAAGVVSAHIKDEHVSKAKETIKRWFGDDKKGHPHFGS